MSEIVIDSTAALGVLPWRKLGRKDRIVQNIHNILNTYKYEVAYNREFGLTPDIIDQPLDVAKDLIAEDLRYNINNYEPRANLVSVDVQGIDADGSVVAVVKIEI